MQLLSTVTLNCQVTIVTNSGSQLSELKSVSQMSQVSKIVFAIVFFGSGLLITLIKEYFLDKNLGNMPTDNFDNFYKGLVTDCETLISILTIENLNS